MGRVGGTRCAISDGHVHTVVFVVAFEKYTRPSAHLHYRLCEFQLVLVPECLTWQDERHVLAQIRHNVGNAYIVQYHSENCSFAKPVNQ